MMAVSMSRNVAPCSLVKGTDSSEVGAFCICLSKYRSDTFLRNVRKFLQDTRFHNLEQCFSTAGPRPDTGPLHQLYRAARDSPGIDN